MVGTYSLRAWSALACLFFTLATRVTHAEEKISEEAKLYFQNGVELVQNQPPNYQDAYYQFKLAWDRSHSWKVLGNWGLCALKLERDGEAIWASDSEARSECITVASGLICPERTRAQFDSAKSQGSIATILLIGGGVFTAAGVGMIVLGGPKSDQPQQARLRISPILDLRQAGVFAQGAF